MGTYLSCGLAHQITIKSRYAEDSDKILKRIGQNIDLNLYDKYEMENCILLEIKEDVFEKYAVDFIIEQSKYFRRDNNSNIENELKQLKNLKYFELIEKAEGESIFNFQLAKGGCFCNNISYLDPNGNCDIFCDLISYIFEGKVFLECYNSIFTYLRNCIINSSKNPIRTAVMVTEIG